MAEKVWITIKGIRTMDGERENVNEDGSGEYYRKNGKHYIIWHHDGNIARRIGITENSMTVTESNGGNAMNFEKGTKTRTLYGTPGGKVLLEIRTHDFCLCREENLLEAEVDYSLFHDGSHISDSRIKVTVCSQKV